MIFFYKRTDKCFKKIFQQIKLAKDLSYQSNYININTKTQEKMWMRAG